jgi:hypothetical protein
LDLSMNMFPDIDKSHGGWLHVLVCHLTSLILTLGRGWGDGVISTSSHSADAGPWDTSGSELPWCWGVGDLL